MFLRRAVPFLAAITPSLAMAQTDPTDWNAVAKKIVERMALKPRERVLLVGVPSAANALAPALRAAVLAAGAADLGAVAEREPAPESWQTDFTREVARRSGAALDDYVATADVAVMMPGAQPSDRVYAAMQRVLRSGKRHTVHFHWAGAYGLDNALEPTTPDVARLYQRVLLTTDYAALGAKQRAFETAMRGKTVHVTTPAGTDLRFRIGDRTVTKQDGDASSARAAQAKVLIDREVELPAGAIRVAPLEESVEGNIAFPPSDWAGTRVEGLVITIARGQVTNIRAKVGGDAVERELAAGGAAARSFREFALGLNPLLAIPSEGRAWIPYYGYGAGVVRLSLGDNSELGGASARGEYVRWNFFTDATVSVGSDVWVRNGKLVR